MWPFKPKTTLFIPTYPCVVESELSLDYSDSDLKSIIDLHNEVIGWLTYNRYVTTNGANIIPDIHSNTPMYYLWYFNFCSLDNPEHVTVLENTLKDNYDHQLGTNLQNLYTTLCTRVPHNTISKFITLFYRSLMTTTTQPSLRYWKTLHKQHPKVWMYYIIHRLLMDFSSVDRRLDSM